MPNDNVPMYCHWCGKAHETYLCPAVVAAFEPDTAEGSEGKRIGGQANAREMKERRIRYLANGGSFSDFKEQGICSTPNCGNQRLRYGTVCRECKNARGKAKYRRDITNPKKRKCAVAGCTENARPHFTRCRAHNSEYQSEMYRQRMAAKGIEVKSRRKATND